MIKILLSGADREQEQDYGTRATFETIT